MYKVRLIQVVLILVLLTAFIPVATTHAQADPLVTVTITEASVEPGQPITVNWVVSSHVRRFHHVAIELNHPSIFQPITVTATGRTGSIQMTIPADYYDKAIITVYPQKSNNQNYKDAAGKVISATAEIVVDDGVEIKSLTLTPDPAQPNGTVTVAWEVTYREEPAPRLVLIYPSDGDFYANEYNLPLVGSMTLTIPAYYTESFFVTLTGEKILMGETVEISVACPFSEYYTQAETCPISRGNSTLTYQYFEKGLMVLWGDSIFILVYGGGAFSDHPNTGDMSGIEVPEGLQLADGVFSGTWLIFRDRVGFATGDAGTYSTTVETHPDYSGRHKAIGYWFGGPDGNLIYANPLRLVWSLDN